MSMLKYISKYAQVTVIPLTLLMMLTACGGGSGSASGPDEPPGTPGNNPAPADPPNQSNEPPVVTISSPLAGDSFSQGESVRFEGRADEDAGGELNGASLVWTAAAVGEFGTGNHAETADLPPGQHSVVLTATDSDDRSASTSVVVRIVAPAPAADARFGERNPYGGRIQRLPAKRDDELLVIGRTATGAMSIGLLDTPVSMFNLEPTADPIAPRVTEERAAHVPLAASAGRTLESSLEQLALVSRVSGGGNELLFELYAFSADEQIPIAARTFFDASSGPVAVLAADLDVFDEISGARAIEAPTSRAARYHNEVALAHPEIVNGQRRGRIHVLSFETLDFPEHTDAIVPGPTSAVSALTSQPMLAGSRIVLRHGDALSGFRPHLLVAYLNQSREVVLDLFEYQRTRVSGEDNGPATDVRALMRVDLVADDSSRDVLRATPALPASTAQAHGWDVAVGRGHALGTHSELHSHDVAFVVWHAGGAYHKRAWKLTSGSGQADPEQLAHEHGRFGRFRDVSGATVDLDILPDSEITVDLARVTSNLNVEQRCETIGLMVRADTNRGPAIQAMYGRLGNPISGTAGELGPIHDEPVWPSGTTLQQRPHTDATSQVSFAGGGFVTRRNALIDHRRDSQFTGSPEFAEDCAGTNTGPYLGPLASFYVAVPAAGELHSVTLDLNRTVGSGTVIVHPLPLSTNDTPFLVAADVDGDAGYYRSLRCVQHPSTGAECRTIFLGDAELHYVLDEIETQSIILQQPPKHVDYLPALGGIVDVSMSDQYFAEFAQTDFAGGNISRKSTVDWRTGTRVTGGLGAPKLKSANFNNAVELTVSAEIALALEDFESIEVDVSLRQVSGAVDDDVVWSRLQTVDYWRFPAQGGLPHGNPNASNLFDDAAYIDLAIPSSSMSMVGPGTLNDSYQPKHQVGNILSYPTFSGDVNTLGDLFNYLGNYIPMDAEGRRQCQSVDGIDPFGCLIQVGSQLRRVAEISEIDEYVAGRFEPRTNTIDVVEVLQVGGTSYSAELRFDEEARQGNSISYDESITAELDVKLPIKVVVKKVPLQVGEIRGNIKSSLAASNVSTSESRMGSNTTISLHVPSSIPIERSYRIRPSFGFSPAGTLKVSYQVSTEGAASTFWEQHYDAPDPALNLPHRIVRTPTGYRLGTDNSRNRMRGFFVRDGAEIDPADTDPPAGPMFDGVPSDGDPVQLEVRVYNLSLGTAVSNLRVMFEAQRYVGGQPVDEPIYLGDTMIEFLPHRGQYTDLPNGHITRARFLWDTSGFGDTAGQALRSYLIWVTLDPDNAIPNEVHNLHDRFDDPLLSATGEPIDVGIEKGQNNRGWSLVRLAPSGAATASHLSAAMQTPPAGIAKTAVATTPLTLTLTRLDLAGEANEPIDAVRNQSIPLRVGIQSQAMALDGGHLRVFDGNPRTDGMQVLSRHVPGLSGDTSDVEDFMWRPDRTGDHQLYVRFHDAGGETHRLQVPVRVRDELQ